MSARPHRCLFAAVLSGALVLSACSSSADDQVAGPGALGHIHDLVVDESGSLLAAAHTGLYRIESVDRAVLVGTEQHDLMSMAADNTSIIASGHPDLRLPEYRVDGLRSHLGLARTIDGGHTWTVEADLLGQHDFHALEPTELGIYAADSEGIIMLRQLDGSWQDRGPLTARDLAASPADPNHLVATDEEGTAWYSDDGATTWAPLADAPPVIEIEWTTPDRVVAASEDGVLWQTARPQGPWTQVASGPEEVETLHISGDQWWVTIHGGAIHTSTDDGATWSPVYLPPER